jgi:hypothetical protein
MNATREDHLFGSVDQDPSALATVNRMKSVPDKKTKKSLVVPFSYARKALIDDMVARTPIVKVPSRLRLTK